MKYSIIILWVSLMVCSASVFAQNCEDTSRHLTVDKPARPPQNYVQTIQENLRYPKEAKRNQYQKRIMILLVIDCDGSIYSAEALHVDTTDIHNVSLANEALRVARLLDTFTPAVREGKNVRYSVRLPIDFKLKE